MTDLLSEQNVLDWWLRYDLERDSVSLHGPGGELAALGLVERRGEGCIELVRPDSLLPRPRGAEAGCGRDLLAAVRHGLDRLPRCRLPWRHRGLGRALLLHAFVTGATRLYERVGMCVAWQADLHEREL